MSAAAPGALARAHARPSVRSCATLIAALAAAATIGACTESFAPRPPTRPLADATSDLAAQVRQLAATRGIGPLPAPPTISPALSLLGQMLAFDPIMSGNRDIACMTCHHPKYATGDARSLSIGQGGRGLGPARVGPFIARNAPSLFNLHMLQSAFWDGRVAGNRESGYHTPAGAALGPEMTSVMQFGPVSAQPLFPLLARAEMRGDSGTNELANLPDSDPDAIWNAIMARLRAIPAYKGLFEAAYPGLRFEDMNLAYASNAIAAFFLDKLTFNHTPWDQFLAGDDGALSGTQLQGAHDFLTLKCSICHNGPAFTDNKFHNVAVAQIGPGEGDGPTGHDDFGRMRVTGQATDLYTFRTSPLRNIELTGPYGHDGAIVNLTDFIRHYSQSDVKLESYDPSQLEPLLQNTLQPTAQQILATRDTLLNGVVLSEELVQSLAAYMTALTDPAARDLSALIPVRVPSGLPVGGH